MKFIWIIIALCLTTLYSLRSAAEDQVESPMKNWTNSQVSSGFSGSVLIARGSDIRYEQGFGFADEENHLPFTADTVFDVMSITKQFTAAAILKLEEQGALSVQHTLDQYFEDVPEPKRSITIHHLLTHTAGLKNYYKSDYKKATRNQLEKYVLTSRLIASPGEEYHYSNVGYGLLGLIIEKASGKRYEEFLNEHLFKPAGMTKTGYTIPDWSSEELAVGYRSRAAGWYGKWENLTTWLGRSDRWGTPLDQYWATDGPWWSLHANGGLLSTMNDLHLWHLALQSDLILSEKSKKKLFTPYVKKNPDKPEYYSYGWTINFKDGITRNISHGGANPYFIALYYYSVEKDLLLLLFSNDHSTVDSKSINGLIRAMHTEY